MSPEELRQRFLDWRGVEEPCRTCDGAGKRTYGSTATWRGGMGGAAMTVDVCDTCWGTGDRWRIGADLRRLRSEEQSRIAAAAVDLLAQSAGANLQTARGDVLQIALLLRTEADKEERARRPARGRWFIDLVRSLAGKLEAGARGTA